MSRHIFDAVLEGQQIRITVGYDRASSSYYLHIGWVDPRSGSIFAYASDLKVAYDPTDWKTIRRFLESLSVTVPSSVWAELAYDREARAGNRVVKHLGDGAMNVLVAW
jgi:hypothetical protein